MKIKKILETALTLALVFQLTACENEQVEEIEEETVSNFKEITAMELVSEIKVGWNLGNTLDSRGTSGLSAERSWGNPTTSPEMIAEVKNAGFNAIRIPTTWEFHIGEGPDYIIDADWLGRVNEIVDYAVANDMYIILNTHHDEWYFPTYETEKEDTEQLVAIWKQIAERFKDYDEHLIFEGLNEPRLRGTQNEWTSGTDESRDVINNWMAAFVETVRSSGGNNDKRFLMLTPYCASSNPEAYKALILPENDKNIIVSIHAYTPHSMCLADGGRGNFLSSVEGAVRDIDKLFTGLKETFVDNGIPVIIGETGARNKDNLGNRVIWADYFFSKSAECGIPAFWWDNGAFSTGEAFGMLDRHLVNWRFPDIVKAIMTAIENKAPLYTGITDVSELTLS